MKKRAFLLLEILIAFSLVALCIVPLVTQPLKLYKEEIAYLEKMEMERLADWTFTEVKEILLKNEIPWKKIPGKHEHSASFSLPPATIEVPGIGSKSVKRSFYLSGRGEKIGLKDEVFRQLGVYILLNGQKYSFRLPIQKIE